ncbi:mercury(II) reductase [Henriciella pelagia]|uniref:mercury(II) reductase n=1 Tax=Henriciella pelagia TaxID=1977912 RepID=UPI0026C7767D
MKDCCSGGNNGEYDIAVVGAGSAGFSAAITAAEAGARVAIIGHGTIGGTCVNVGCVPSKAVIRAMESAHAGVAARRFAGVHVESKVDDWSALQSQKNALVSELRDKKYEALLPEYENIDYLETNTPARLIDGGVTFDGQTVRASKTIIATGSSSSTPPIPGIENVETLDSTSALELERLPESMVVIGGGVIGCELGQMFARAGVRVTICCRSRLIPEAEPEISAALQASFEAEGITVCSGVAYQHIEQTQTGVALHCETDKGTEVVNAKRVLVATGRRPNTQHLGLDEIGVDTDARGGILVDDHMRSSNRSIYAAGDVTGRDQFVYMAAYGAKLAAKHATDQSVKPYENSAMPWVVFSDPQVAGVGLTASAAEAKGYDVKTSIAPLDLVPRALAAADTRGLIKLVADRKTDKLLGAQIMAPEGADSIQTLVLALKFGMTTKELGETIFPYLTTVEGFKLAAQGFDKDVAKLSCCAG